MHASLVLRVLPNVKRRSRVCVPANQLRVERCVLRVQSQKRPRFGLKWAGFSRESFLMQVEKPDTKSAFGFRRVGVIRHEGPAIA
jgi:hypothetical protein